MTVSFVLVEPARGGNVGAAARALKTMGFSDLRIVGHDVTHYAEATAFAHGSTDILGRATIHESVEDAVADAQIVVATTARRRGNLSEYLTPSQLCAHLSGGRVGNHVAILFGPEERGLSNEELRHAQLVSVVPMRSEYPSLNLGQAVMVYAYALASLAIPHARAPRPTPDAQTIRALVDRVEFLLPRLGFDTNRALAERIRERAAQLSLADAKIAFSIVHAIERRLLEDSGPER